MGFFRLAQAACRGKLQRCQTILEAAMAITDHAPDLPLVRLVPIPRLAQGGKWRVEAMRSYSTALLLWFTRGQGRITAGGVTRGYGPHNLIYLPPGTMHAFELNQHVHGTAMFLPQVPELNLPDRIVHLRIRDAIPQGEMSVMLDHIQREIDGNKPGRARAIRHHLGLLSVWLERQILLSEAGETAPKPSASVRLARAYADKIEREFRSGKSVADYARDLGVTPTHLSRVCRETCGRPASALLHDRQLFEARRLLAETKIPVQDIAQALGFGSAAYFSRSFQARTGKTPTAFRRAG
jgi:AraC family transcriptional activator of pobA